VPQWARAKYPNYTGMGRFDSASFDPMTWKPNYPNPAFLLMDSQDAFWAAKQAAAFSDDEIRALVETGEYSDARATQWIAKSLMKRRDKIAEAWFSKVPPLDKFLVEGKLTFDDLQAGRGTGSDASTLCNGQAAIATCNARQCRARLECNPPPLPSLVLCN